MKVFVNNPLSLLYKVGEEERGVADDASSPRLLMLTALQDKPIIHVALRMQAGLDRDKHTHKYAFHHYNRINTFKFIRQQMSFRPIRHLKMDLYLYYLRFCDKSTDV